MRVVVLVVSFIGLWFTLLAGPAHASARSEQKAKEAAILAEVKAAYTGTLYALKDLPVNSGSAMGMSYISPLVEVSPTGFKIDTSTAVQSTYGGAKTVWFGVRVMDTLVFEEATYDDGILVLAFLGSDKSKGRDTKIKVTSGTFAEVKPVLDQLVSPTSPIDPSWPADVRQAIENRVVINGMTKAQAYLVVGEPTSAQSMDIAGQKVDMWYPRNNNGVRFGFGVTMEMTNYPPVLKFQEGKTVELANSASGGVSLE